MKNSKTIAFDGKEYPAVEFQYDGMTVTVSTESLENALLPNGEDFASDAAEIIDSEIFFYVEDSQIGESEEKIREIISRSI